MLALLLLLAPCPLSDLSSPEWHVRDRATRDLGTWRALPALVLVPPLTPEADWRQRAAVRRAVGERLTFLWAVSPLLADPTCFDRDPEYWLGVIDEWRLFKGYRDCGAWYYIHVMPPTNRPSDYTYVRNAALHNIKLRLK